ncbi:DUF6473 family protein [Octadecabacter sp. 1_MG-2023]|uniref:DUF6473 family protein n=1 Tax=unclassified Octadecabacter TaxID=196158 RepID=UPI001C0A05A8|nr:MULTISPECIES: DUF6473 family protein [unclassified Octadecabacter]MBU2992629.1 hypothetical protein [Octadecabacter sp. B2R22]MDO6734614.1 DUF6473 family protein [Octadecabacter sp. 1_MG-2023]
MKSDIKPRGALRLAPCHYGLSKLPFRGPMRSTEGRFVAFLGGSETFAKYIRNPYPDRVETEIGEVCINLGFQSAGPDVFLRDTAVQSLCHDAVATIIQVLNVANVSNSFYKVHPRRNDRFVGPTDKLKQLFPEVDFTEIAFTGHLVARLRAEDEQRFELVKEHLQRTWLRRMKTLVGRSGGPVVVLWLRQSNEADALVTARMVEGLRDYVAQIVEVAIEKDGLDEKCYAPLDTLGAADAMGAKTHAAVAKALRGPLMACLR